MRSSVRRSLTFGSILVTLSLVAACGSDSPTGPTVGSMMTVAEQVAIPGAMEKVAKALEGTGQAADSTLAGFTRVAAQLIGRSGIQGTVVATNAALQAPDSMHAVAGLITEGSGVGATQLHFVLAWSGLDVNAFTVQRAFVLLVDGNGQTTGSFSLTGPSTTATARYVEPATPTIVDNSAGTLSVDSARFGDACTGAPSQAGVTCESGSESVGVQFSGTSAGGASLSWDATLLPTYHLTVTGTL
ncbi:MAG TPA: hypothetical protein VFJ96_09880 [Gemmatimonadaceae bacterium]|nr:hypothetical protein [Gemmatimonadaceae bacterium]